MGDNVLIIWWTLAKNIKVLCDAGRKRGPRHSKFKRYPCYLFILLHFSWQPRPQGGGGPAPPPPPPPPPPPRPTRPPPRPPRAPPPPPPPPPTRRPPPGPAPAPRPTPPQIQNEKKKNRSRETSHCLSGIMEGLMAWNVATSPRAFRVAWGSHAAGLPVVLTVDWRRVEQRKGLFVSAHR